METAGKLLLGAAALLAVVGGGLLLAAKLGVTRLPGDVVVKRGNWTFYAPVGLMVALSLVLTLVLTLLGRR